MSNHELPANTDGEARKKKPTVRAATPAALADLALIDGPSAAAGACESVSKFLDGVRRTAAGELKEGEVPYPQPVVRMPRFTRYPLSDVRTWLIERAKAGTFESAGC